MIISNLKDKPVPTPVVTPKVQKDQEKPVPSANMASNMTLKPEVKPSDSKVENQDYHQFIPRGVSNYISRTVDTDIDFWSQLHNGKPLRNVALIGESGSGKNFAVANYASRSNLPLLVVPCDDSQVLKELLGYWKAASGTTIWCEGLLTQFLRIPSVILFDEVNCLPPGKLFMLHELLENRKLFIKDAPSDQSIVKLHDGVRIFLSMNPPEARYSGTSRLNTALGTRTSWVEILPFRDEEIMTEKTGDEELDGRILQFYREATRVIKEQKLRVTICKRNIDAIVDSLRLGLCLENSLLHGFINSALATASAAERDVLLNLAITVFGASKFPKSIKRIKGE